MAAVSHRCRRRSWRIGWRYQPLSRRRFVQLYLEDRNGLPLRLRRGNPFVLIHAIE